MNDGAARNSTYPRELRKLRPSVRAAASESLLKILQGVSTFCLEHGFGRSEVEAALRLALITQARENCKLHEREPNVSRLAIITGITRKRVREIRLDLDRTLEAMDLPPGRLVKFVDAWQTESAYLDSSGRPRPLNCSGPGHGEFGDLARNAAGDIPPTALLRELLRMGAVEKKGELVELVSHELLAQPGAEGDGLLAIKIAGDAVRDFFSTINNNLTPEANPLFERRVVAEDLSESELEEFKSFAEEQGREFLKTLNQWVLDKRRLAQPAKQRTLDEADSRRIGVGLYLFKDDKSSELVE